MTPSAQNAIDLESLLTLWRDTRAPELVPLVALLGEKTSVDETKKLEGLKPVALAAALLEELRRTTPEKLHTFLPVVDRFVRSSRGSWPVVELLADLPPDPRLARLALALLRDFDDLPHKSNKLWRRLVDLVETHGDPDAGALVLSMPSLGTRGPLVRPRLENVAKRLARSKALPPEELAEIRAQVEAFVPGSGAKHASEARVLERSRGEALLAAIDQDPNDDAARLVYADWLSSQNDPRGEFIVLQFQRAEGTSTSAGKKREAALLRKHFRDWVGPLRSVLTPVQKGIDALERGELSVPVDGYDCTTFHKGFLSRVNPVDVPRHRFSALDDPIWSTVRRVAFVPSFTRAMSSLRHVDRCFPEALASIGRLPNTLDFVGVSAARYRQADPSPALRCRVKRVNVEVTHVAGRVMTWLDAMTTASPVLESLCINGASFDDWRARWSWLALDGAPPSFSLLDVRFRGNDDLIVHRGSGSWDTIEIWPRSQEIDRWSVILAPFAERPARSIVVHQPPGEHARLEALIRRFGDDVRVLP